MLRRESRHDAGRRYACFSVAGDGIFQYNISWISRRYRKIRDLKEKMRCLKEENC